MAGPDSGRKVPKPGRTRMSDSNECLGGPFCLGSVFGSAMARRFGKSDLTDERSKPQPSKSKAGVKPFFLEGF